MSPIRVVLVDDSELIRRGLALCLSSADGFEVVGEAGDGASGLEVVARTKPDVVLSDVKMPRMTGLELAHAVHRDHPDLPVLLLTTFDDAQIVREAMDAHVAGFLLKDSSTDDLVAAITAATQGGLVLDPRIARAAVTAVPSRASIDSLTPAELKVARLVATGATNGEIARELWLSEGTVKNHVSALLRKLEARDRTALVLHLGRVLGDDTQR